MTPKEKATELYDKFHVWDTMNHKEVKTLSLVAVDEIIELLDFDLGHDSTAQGLCNYWKEIKKELKKL